MSRSLVAAALFLAACPRSKDPVSAEPVPEPDVVAEPMTGPAEPMDGPAVIADSDDRPDLTPPEGGPVGVQGRDWHLVALPGTDVDPEGMWFRVEGSELTGNGGCNHLFGNEVAVGEGTFTFGPVGSTRMACPNLSDEQTFVRVLGEIDGYTLEGDLLTLRTGDAERATFR